MPINEDEWDKKSKFEEDKEKVYEFLKQNYPKAFTADEIINSVKLPKIDGGIKDLVALGFDWKYLSDIFSQLKKENKIESKNIDGKTYYKAKA